MNGLTEGRIVHYVLQNGVHRPAIVVKVWRYSEPVQNESDEVVYTIPENGCSNLQVFTDSDPERKYNDQLDPVTWCTSVLFSETKEPHTWHWIEQA